MNGGEPDENGEIVAVIEDDNGKVRSRYKGTSWKEVADKILNSQANATEEIGRLKKGRLPDQGRIESVIAPRELTSDERFSIAINLTDPDKSPEAMKQLITATIGAPPETVSRILSDIQKKEMAQYIQDESWAFRQEHPDYYNCDENMYALFDAMEQRHYPYSRNNLAIVYDDIKTQGRLIPRPSDDEQTEELQPVSQQRPNTAAEPNPPRPTTRPRSIATGIRNSDASGLPPLPRQKYSRAEIATMSREEFEKKMRDPAFRKAMDLLG
jgi:hypothetical protein